MGEFQYKGVLQKIANRISKETGIRNVYAGYYDDSYTWDFNWGNSYFTNNGGNGLYFALVDPQGKDLCVVLETEEDVFVNKVVTCLKRAKNGMKTNILYQGVEKMANSLKCYNGVIGSGKYENGFEVSIRPSIDVYTMSERGRLSEEFEVYVTAGSIKYRGNAESKNIVGLSQIVDAAERFLKQNKLNYINIGLDLLRGEGKSRRYIRVVEFTWR